MLKKHKKSNTDDNLMGYKYRIYPTDEQATQIDKTIGCARFIYNQLLDDFNVAYKQYGVSNFRSAPADYKGLYKWLYDVDSLALCNAQLNLGKAIDSFFSGNAGKPKFKSKRKSRLSYTTNYVNNNIKLTDKAIKLPCIKQPIKIKLHRPQPSGSTIKSVTVSKTKSGKYFVSILFKLPDVVVTSKPVTTDTTIGLDYASNGLYVDSNNNCANYPKYYRQSENKLKRAQKKLSKKVNGSKNRQKACLKVAKLYEKVANQRADYLHKLSRQLVTDYSCVCLEDLNMQSMSQTLKLGKATMDNGFGMFRVMLNYKAKQTGTTVVKVGKHYASSKLCNHCGHKNTELKLSDRKWVCKHCGSVIARDYNAACNIRDEGLRLLGL